MTEYKINNVTVRIFGTPNEERIKEACKQYVKGLNHELISPSDRGTETNRRETELRSVLGHGVREDFRRLRENA